MISVEIASDTIGERWNAFVRQQHPDHFAYTWEWRQILSRTFGHKPYYLIAFRGDEVDGVLPLFHVKSFLFGSALISVPYLNAGGILAASPAAFAALLLEAQKLKEKLKVRYVEFRARNEESGYKNETGFPLAVRTHKVAMRLPLPETEESLFNQFDKKLRSQIRRPAKDGVTAQMNSPTAVADFYTVFARNMRDLGTPVYPRRLWEEVRRELPDSQFLVAFAEGKPVAAGVTIGFGDSVEIPWASSLREYNRLSPNMLLYWEALRGAIRGKFRVFDFGRSSKDSTTFRFKSQWGAEPKTLHWYYIASPTDVPEVNPKSRKFALLVAIWQRLPLFIANRIGPFVTRSLP